MNNRLDRPRLRAVIALGLAVAAALVVAACGGSSDATTNTSGSSGRGTQGGSARRRRSTSSVTRRPRRPTTRSTRPMRRRPAARASRSRPRSPRPARRAARSPPVSRPTWSRSRPRLTSTASWTRVWSTRTGTAGPAKGIVNDSVVVMIVRPGNPKHITGWDDLIKSGIKVVTPNPATSGSARWNIMAAYGAQLKEGKSPTQALDYVATLLEKNTVTQPDSGAATRCRRSSPGRATCCSTTSPTRSPPSGPATRSSSSYPKSSILIETPIAVDQEVQPPVAGAGIHQVARRRRGRSCGASRAIGRCSPSVAKQFTSTFPTIDTVHDRQPRRLDEGHQGLLHRA